MRTSRKLRKLRQLKPTSPPSAAPSSSTQSSWEAQITLPASCCGPLRRLQPILPIRLRHLLPSFENYRLHAAQAGESVSGEEFSPGARKLKCHRLHGVS